MALTQKQLDCIEMQYKGIQNQDIALSLGIHYNTITKWSKKDEYKAAQKEYVDTQINQAASRAAQTIFDLMENAKSETVRLNAAKDILSRAGYDAVARIEAKTENENKTIVVGWDSKDEELTPQELAKAQKDIEENPDHWITISYK